MRRVILSLLVSLFVVMAIAASAGGPLHTWKIVGVPTRANGYTALVWENGSVFSTKPLSASTRKGLCVYFAIDNDEQLMQRQFQGDDVDQTLVQLAKWADNMTTDDKMNEALAKGILTFESFDLPKGMMLSSKKDFHGLQLDKLRYERIDERVRVLSNFTCELGAAKASDFNLLATGMAFDTLAVNETVKILESVSPLEIGPVTTKRSKSIRVHRFYIIADRSGAVVFDSKRLSEEDMNAPGPTCEEAVQTEANRRHQFSGAARPITMVR